MATVMQQLTTTTMMHAHATAFILKLILILISISVLLLMSTIISVVLSGHEFNFYRGCLDDISHYHLHTLVFVLICCCTTN